MNAVIETEKVIKNLHSNEPAVALKAAEKILTKVEVKKIQKQPEVKSVTITMTQPSPEVSFKGEGWCVMDIKFAWAALKRGFREMQRKFYLKEYEKK